MCFEDLKEVERPLVTNAGSRRALEREHSADLAPL
jgi:hypothetical protein